MNLLPLPKFHHYHGQIVKYVQHKLNGHYIQVYRGQKDDIQIYTKIQTENIWPKLRCCKTLEKSLLSLPAGTIFEAELYAEGIFATSIPTLLNDGDNRLLIGPFCLHTYCGEDVSISEMCILKSLQREHICPPEWTEFLQPHKLSEKEQQIYLKLATAKHLEGWVLKERHHSGWYKLKPTKTVDCVVIGFTKSESDTKYGALKAVQVAVRDNHKLVKIASVGSGFSDDFRWEIKPETLLGRVCEVKYDCVAANGKLNFPRFIRWRDDKKANDCTKDQLEE